MKIALASIDMAWEDKGSSLACCAALVRRAAAAGADLVVFPEMTLTGFTMQATSVAEPAHRSPSIEAFAALARDNALHIAFGVVLEGRERPVNCLVVVDREGREAGRYAKVHPFGFADEDRHYERGDRAVRVRLDDVAFGLTICYDLRFPELYTALAPDCDAVLVIANWPAARIAHWHLLARARALDAQCCIIAVNRTGTDGNGLEYPRSSAVFGPWGQAIDTEVEGELEYAVIDPGEVRRARREFPLLRDRRPALYARLNENGGES